MNPETATEPEAPAGETAAPPGPTPAAARALAEAAARRALAEAATPPREVNGRKGPEPTRFGDWEKNGILSDF